MIALDLLGASPGSADRDGEATAEDFTLTDEQLVNVDRALTPSEQKRVDAYQERQARKAQADEEAKGGPTATMTVTRRGALVEATPSATTGEGKPKLSVWLLFGLGGALLLGLLVGLLRGKKR